MLIGFLGAPSSGKTTTALGLAYTLKLQGYPTEYLPEPARFVIRELGYNDQNEILKRELQYVELAKNNPESIWITDGGAYMGQFYGGVGSDLWRNYDCIIHCPVVFSSKNVVGRDTGRIHSDDFSTRAAHQMGIFANNVENVLTFDYKENNITDLTQEVLQWKKKHKIK
jgi:adenylate kinase family enzyme